MKYLNKNFRNSSLNKRIRALYDEKQKINNSKLPSEEKKMMMKDIDKKINAEWRGVTSKDFETTTLIE